MCAVAVGAITLDSLGNQGHTEAVGRMRMLGETIHLSESGHLLLLMFTSQLDKEHRVQLEGRHVNQDVLSWIQITCVDVGKDNSACG